MPKSPGMVFAAEWQNHEDGAPLVSDYDQDSGPELIASFAVLGSATEARLPFATDWDDDRYRVISLMRKPPQLDERGLDSSTIAYRQEAYQTRISLYDTIPDPSGNRTLIGWRVQAFAVVQQPNPRVLTGYSMRTPVNGQTHLLELHASQIRSGDPPFPDVSSVSCVSAGNCSAVGTYGDPPATGRGFC